MANEEATPPRPSPPVQAGLPRIPTTPTALMAPTSASPRPAPETPTTPAAGPTLPPGRAHAPPVGTKIQVLWRIVYDESKAMTDEAPTPEPKKSLPQQMDVPSTPTAPNTVERWWGAVVQDRTNEKVGAKCEAYADHDVYILLYDAYNEFTEETSRVAFLPDNVLLDLSMLDDAQGGRLDWVDEASLPTANQYTPTAVRSAECIAREADDMVLQSGLPADADLQALASMPHNVQVHVATGYRSFADAIKRNLGELLASKPEGYVVTADDVHSIMARVRSQQNQRRATDVLQGSVL